MKENHAKPVVQSPSFDDVNHIYDFDCFPNPSPEVGEIIEPFSLNVFAEDGDLFPEELDSSESETPEEEMPLWDLFAEEEGE